MRLKKLAAAVMAGTLSVFALTGCSAQNENYFKEVEKTSSWDAIESKIDGSMSLNIMGENMDFNFNGDGYFNQADNKTHMVLNFDNDKSEIKIPSIDMYLDNTIAYMNKDYYTGVFTMNGLEVPEGLDTIPAQYIGIDTGLDVDYMKSLSTADGLMKFKKDLIGNTEIEIPMTQNEREYSVDLNEQQIADLLKNIVNGASDNLSGINTTLNLGLDEATLNTVKTSLKSDEFKAQLNNLKDLITGSTIKLNDKFEDNSYTSSVEINLQIKDVGSMSIKVNAVSTKADKKAVEIPLGRVKFTQQEYLESVAPEAAAQISEDAAQ